jgi:hypothetical protein
MEQVADDDELSPLHIHAGDDLRMEPPIRLVTVLLRAHPFAVLGVVNHDELRPVLEMAQSPDLLPARTGKDPHAVRQHDVLLLPFLALALQGKVLYDRAGDLAVILLDEVVRLQLVLDGTDVQRRLAGRVGDEDDDEGILFRMLQRSP